MTQTFFEVGHLGGVFRDQDYPALEVAAQILGGGFSSRLFRRVRTELGYAYNVGAGWGAQYDHPGLFTISGSTQSKHTVDTLKAVREELDKIRVGEVTDQELQTAKDTVLNSFVFRFDRPSKTLNRLLIYEYYGYPRDFIFQYQKAIAAVTKADVLRAAQKYFRPQDLTYVAVGNSKEFGTPLMALGSPVQPIDLTIPEPKHETAQADAASLAKGKQLLERVQDALGGAAKLAAVKDVLTSADVELSTGGGAMKIKQKNSFAAPSSLRQDVELPFGKQSVYSDGQSGWMSGPQGAQPIPPQVLKQVQGELFRQLFRLALSNGDPDRTVNYAGDGVLEISSKTGDSVKLKVDEKTGLPVEIMYLGSAMGGAPQQVEELFSDWRETGGIQLPFKRSILQGGKKLADVTIQDVKINSGLTAEELSKKP